MEVVVWDAGGLLDGDYYISKLSQQYLAFKHKEIVHIIFFQCHFTLSIFLIMTMCLWVDGETDLLNNCMRRQIPGEGVQRIYEEEGCGYVKVPLINEHWRLHSLHFFDIPIQIYKRTIKLK